MCFDTLMTTNLKRECHLYILFLPLILPHFNQNQCLIITHLSSVYSIQLW